MGFVNGVNLLPSTGEFTYATTARLGQRVTEAVLTGINFYFAGGPPKTDYSYSIDQLQDAFPACTTVAVVCAWFGNSTDAAACQIYPSTTYIDNGSVIDPATGLPWPTVPNAFQYWNGSSYTADHWRCSSLDETSAGLIPISSDVNGTFTNGGTPSEQSIAEFIADLKARGLLDETLVIWGGEFGRTSMNEARGGSTFLGRDHHPHCFTIWMAGAGVKAGTVLGATDELGYFITEDKVGVHDLQATILHLLGLDADRLRFPFQGLENRLIGPEDGPSVVKQVLA